MGRRGQSPPTAGTVCWDAVRPAAGPRANQGPSHLTARLGVACRRPRRPGARALESRLSRVEGGDLRPAAKADDASCYKRARNTNQRTGPSRLQSRPPFPFLPPPSVPAKYSQHPAQPCRLRGACKPDDCYSRAGADDITTSRAANCPACKQTQKPDRHLGLPPAPLAQLSRFQGLVRLPPVAWRGPESMAGDMAPVYNATVEAFLHDEYPMLKGKRSRRRTSGPS